VNKEEIIEKAWLLYCEETAGSFDVRDYWEQLSENVREYYVHRIIFNTDIRYNDWMAHGRR
jgi:hypothetical protein